MGKSTEYEPDLSLTQMQEDFCIWYCKLKNGTRAAEKAGYKGTLATLGQVAYENLRKPEIIHRVKKITKERNKKTYVDAEKVVERLAMFAFQDPGDYFDDDGNPLPIKSLKKSARVAIRSMKVRIEKDKNGNKIADIIELGFVDAKAATDSLGKHTGVFEKDNNQKNQTVIFNFGSEDEDIV